MGHSLSHFLIAGTHTQHLRLILAHGFSRLSGRKVGWKALREEKLLTAMGPGSRGRREEGEEVHLPATPQPMPLLPFSPAPPGAHLGWIHQCCNPLPSLTNQIGNKCQCHSMNRCLETSALSVSPAETFWFMFSRCLVKHLCKDIMFLFLRGGGHEMDSCRTLKELEIQIGEKVRAIFKNTVYRPRR